MTKSKKNTRDKQKDGSQPAGSLKPKFDKKKWREKKYSKKYQVNEWEKRREKAVVKQYYKELQADPLYAQNAALKFCENDSTSLKGNSSTSRQPRKKLNCYEAAKAEIQKINEEKQKQMEEKIKRKKEMESRLKEYKKKKAEKYRFLSKKNKKGQPVMKGRLEHMYEQIKQSVQ